MSGKYRSGERHGPAGALGDPFIQLLYPHSLDSSSILKFCWVSYLSSSIFRQDSVRFVSSRTPSFQKFLSGSVAIILEEFQGS